MKPAPSRILAAALLIWSAPRAGTEARNDPAPRKPAVPKAAEGMVRIPAGCFEMGSDSGEANEKPAHKVCLGAFQMDRDAVTQWAFGAVMGPVGHMEDGTCSVFNLQTARWEQGAPIGPGFRGPDKPAICVDWNEARAFCAKLGKRLPTEAEFEYAARAGTNTKYFWGDDPDKGCVFANGADRTKLSNGFEWNRKMECEDGFGDALASAGSFKPNPWGLHGMTGNVWQWTADWYGDDYYADSPKKNPKGPSKGVSRVYRGGGWNDRPEYLRSTYRSGIVPVDRNHYLGFRCVSP